MLRRIKFIAGFILAFALSMTSSAAIAGEKLALLIGNSDYQQTAGEDSWTKLPNPANDIDLVAGSLRSIGFEVTEVPNGTWEDMRKAVDEFSLSLDDADIVVFYFAGHGFEYGRRNYLVPVDAPLTASADEIDRTFIEFEALADRLYHEGTTIFMLDACRTSGNVTPGSQTEGAITRSAPAPVIIEPATRQSAAVSAGMREFDFEPGARVAVLYSTGRGIPAYDSAPPPENVSPFAYEVANKITVPKVDVSLVFNTIRQGVFERTEGFWPPQVPFTYNSLAPNTYLADEAPVESEPRDPSLREQAGAEQSLRPIDLSMEELSRIDEPILIVRVLAEHSVADIEALVASGDPLATYLLGYMQHFGMGVAKDLDAARDTLEAAAAQGTPYGQLELAYYLRVNARDDANAARSIALYKSAADQDYAKARAHYARVLIGNSNGDPFDPDYSEGVEQLRLAAEDGYAYAFYGLLYAVPQEREQHIASLRELSASGRRDADQQLCSIFVREEQFADAVPHCQKAADAGYPDAFAHMALSANNGWVAPRSIDDARFWMRQALSRGDLEAGLCAQMVSMQYELAVETNTLDAARILNCSRSTQP